MLIDVSHYQGTINWAQLAAAGVDGAYVKVTDGASGVDANWQTNHAGARAAGIPVGPYHFAEGGNSSAEAAHFASVWPAGWDLHPVLDYEIAGVNAAWLTAFRSDFRADTGFQPFRVYASQGSLVGALNPAGWIDAQTTIWAARYAPTLGWDHPQLVLWQNTSAATVPGVLGHVDVDQFMHGWTPAADQGGPVALTQNDITAITNAILFDTKIAGPNGDTPYSLNDMVYWTNQYANQIPGVDTDVKTSASTVLAAIAKGVAVTLTADQAAQIETQLAAALPGYTVNITPK